jgi:indolepyruvate ferredoxin oxidoreductase beta subunit
VPLRSYLHPHRFRSSHTLPVHSRSSAEYPHNLAEKIAEKGINIEAFDALSLAEEAGTSKAVNLVLLGRISKYFDFTDEEWMDAIEKSVPAKFLELNKKAFSLGKGE